MAWGWERQPQEGERLSELTVLGWLKLQERAAYIGACLSPMELMMLIGCFTIFWTIYYLLEVYLSQRSTVAFRPICQSGPCHWPQRTQKAKEEGTELESNAPLQQPGSRRSRGWRAGSPTT